MTYYQEQTKQKEYTLVSLEYAVTPTENIFFQKANIISDTLKDIYEQLHQRRKIHSYLLSDLEKEVIETESDIYRGKYTPPTFFTLDLKTLDRRLDLLNKTRRTEVVQYWQDVSKLKRDLLKAKEEHQNFLRKEEML